MHILPSLHRLSLSNGYTCALYCRRYYYLSERQRDAHPALPPRRPPSFPMEKRGRRTAAGLAEKPTESMRSASWPLEAAREGAGVRHGALVRSAF